MINPATVFIVDDDKPLREAIALVLRLSGHQTSQYDSAEAFLAAYKPGMHGCLLLDLRMGGMGGLELQRKLAASGVVLPIIFMTAYGDVATARSALKAGAVDFLEKPVNEEVLLKLVEEALAKDADARRESVQQEDVNRRISSLTGRERQVMDRVVAGRHNREIAAELGISARTVEVYKAGVMLKMGVTRIPELVKLVMAAGASGSEGA